MNTHRHFAASLCAAALTILPNLAALAQDRELGAGGVLLDGVAAVVDEGVVLKSELADSLTNILQNLERQQAELPPEERRPLPPVAIIEQQVLEQLVIREIQLQRAGRAGITVNDDMLNETFVLAAQNIDYAMYREDSRRDLIVEALEQRDVVNRISITPRELEQCLVNNESKASDAFDYNISHILVGVPANATQQDLEAARRRIDEVRARLVAGEDFAQVAIAVSQAQTALEGGSLGWRKGAQLPTLFADTVIRLKPGEFSEPIQSAGGFQIVKLNEMRGAERMVVDQAHVRHILLRPNEILDEAAVQQKARDIRAQIEGGDDFATVARAVSDDTGSASDGGDLGWVSPGTTVREFEQAILALPIGELSQPIKSEFGWHLAQVLERRSHDTTDEMKRTQCARQLRAAKAEEERELWVRRLRDQAFVDIRN